MSNNQGNSVDIPDFEQFLQKWLHCSQLKLVGLVAKTMLPLGENYCSDIIKIDATIRRAQNSAEETLQFVAKVSKFIDQPIVPWSDLFLKEVYMYSVIMPAYKSLEREYGEKAVFDAYPKYIGHRCSLHDRDALVDEDSMLVLENLRARGFYTCDRRVGLDLEHSKRALSALANFHATGIAFLEKHPESSESIISQARIRHLDFETVDDGFDTILNTIRENDSLNKHLPVIESTFAEARGGYIITRAESKPWLTIIHGDFWVNNIMFHKDRRGRVDDAKILDFQIYLYRSPLFDLPKFLCCSVDEPTRANYMDELIDHYYETFIGTLEYFRCDTKPFGKAEFNKELKRQAIIMFPGSALALKFFAVKITEEHTSSTIMNDICRSDVNDEVVKELQKLIHIYEKRKWF